MLFLRTSGRLAVISMMACGGARPESVEAPRHTLQLAVIPAENDVYPVAARALSAQLVGADVRAADAQVARQVAKVPLDVVQLSVECVEPTSACYEAIGRSMSANRLLFARIDSGATRSELKVTVTLYDVDAGATMRTAQKIFASEQAAAAGAAALVAQVVR